MSKKVCIVIRLKNLTVNHLTKVEKLRIPEEPEDETRVKNFFDKHVRKPAIQSIFDHSGYPQKVSDGPHLKIYNKRFRTSIHMLEPKQGEGIDLAWHLQNVRYSRNEKTQTGSFRRVPCSVLDLRKFFANFVCPTIFECLDESRNLAPRSNLEFTNEEYNAEVSHYFII